MSHNDGREIPFWRARFKLVPRSPLISLDARARCEMIENFYGGVIIEDDVLILDTREKNGLVFVFHYVSCKSYRRRSLLFIARAKQQINLIETPHVHHYDNRWKTIL